MGKQNWLAPFSRKGKIMLLAYDHGMEHGPIDLKGKSFDPDYILDLALKGKFTGIVLQKGIAEKYYQGSSYSHSLPLIIKINGKTRIAPGEPYSAINCSVSYAKKLGARAIGYTIYLGSRRESEMLAEFGKVQEEAHQLGLATIAWIYPRGEAVRKGDTPEMTAYAARLGLELGADAVKIRYSGSRESFNWAIQVAGKVKVLLSGGPQISEDDFLGRVKNIIQNGGAGIAVGRNVWQREDALGFAQKLHHIIWPEDN